jgi:tetratricopeptide (TPR) repeat protein
MYRRNIIHILLPLGMTLTLFVAYHLFVKPLVRTTSPASTSPESAPEPAPEQPAPTQPMPRGEDAKPARALDQTVVPATQDTALLETIRDAIETGNLAVAESKLMALPPGLLADPAARPFVAILWNNLGLQQERLTGTAASLKSFKKAAALDERNAVIQLNLAHAYWEQRDPALNIDFLSRLATLAPNEPFPHLAMADLLYEQDKLDYAAAHLAQATERMKQDPGLQSYYQMVTAKVRRADQAESRMAARNSTHFIVKFDGGEDQATWTTVLGILEDAYRDIGQRVGHFPSKPITVVLHTKDTFQTATGSPAWADGLFDSVLGRIQIPTQGATTDVRWLTNVLRHEYVHALLHDRVGGSGGFVPTWLNEGLAMQLAGNEWPELDQVMRGEVQVIPLQYLEGSWVHLPHNVATLAYLEANSATHFLIERWGMSRVDELLTAFKARESVAAALQAKLFVSYEQFHSRWLDTFQQRRT